MKRLGFKLGLYEASVVNAEATAAQGPCQTSDSENYRCCHIDEALIETPTDDPDMESEEDATQYVPPAKPAPTDDTTGDQRPRRIEKEEAEQSK